MEFNKMAFLLRKMKGKTTVFKNGNRYALLYLISATNLILYLCHTV